MFYIQKQGISTTCKMLAIFDERLASFVRIGTYCMCCFQENKFKRWQEKKGSVEISNRRAIFMIPS